MKFQTCLTKPGEMDTTIQKLFHDIWGHTNLNINEDIFSLLGPYHRPATAMLGVGGFGGVSLLQDRETEGPLVIKQFTRNRGEIIHFPMSIRREGRMILFNEPIGEIFFSSLASHLFDIGATVNVPKFVEGYRTPDLEWFLTSERFDLTLWDIFQRKMTRDLFWTMILQVLFALRQLKFYFGLVHFDLHPGNIMFKDGRDYIYRSNKFMNFTTLAYHVANRGYITQKNNGVLTKVIDFGLCYVNLNRSQVPKYKQSSEFVVEAVSGIAGGQNALRAVEKDENAANSMDVTFFLLNVLFLLERTEATFGFPDFLRTIYSNLDIEYTSFKKFKNKEKGNNPWLNRRDAFPFSLTTEKVTVDFFIEKLYDFISKGGCEKTLSSTQSKPGSETLLFK